MKKLRTGIIGCGKIADFHARALAQSPHSDFVAVCSRTPEKTATFAARYGVTPYTDVTTMVQTEHLDVVTICTPHTVHATGAIAAANCGCHVLIEKPLAASVADCDAIIEAGLRNHVKIGTLVQRRSYLPCARIKEAIDQGKLGTPILGTVSVYCWRDEAYYQSDPWRGTWAGEGGGVMATQATHQIDLLLWYMGDVASVYGVAKNYNHPYIEVEDTAVAVVNFKNGGVATLVMSNSQNPALFGKVSIHGSNGASVGVQTDGGAMFIAGMSEITEPPYNDIWTIAGEQEKLSAMQQADRDFFNSMDSLYYYHQLQIEDFLTAVLHDRPPFVDGPAGRATVALFNAIYECTKTNQVIVFP